MCSSSSRFLESCLKNGVTFQLISRFWYWRTIKRLFSKMSGLTAWPLLSCRILYRAPDVPASLFLLLWPICSVPTCALNLRGIDPWGGAPTNSTSFIDGWKKLSYIIVTVLSFLNFFLIPKGLLESTMLYCICKRDLLQVYDAFPKWLFKLFLSCFIYLHLISNGSWWFLLFHLDLNLAFCGILLIL